MTIESILIAIALMLILEGIGPALFPNRWQKIMGKLSTEDPGVIRQIGLGLLTVGVLCLFWLV